MNVPSEIDIVMDTERKPLHPPYENRSFSSPWEKKLDQLLLARIPSWIETQHLTLASIIWSAGALASAVLARTIRGWWWVLSVCIVLHYITDHFDGAVGRMRNTGLVRWGYYMDHLLDFLFLSSIGMGYALLFPGESAWIMGALIVTGAMFVHAYLFALMAGRFQISYFRLGGGELALLFIFFNTIAFWFGASAARIAFPLLCAGGSLGLIITVSRAQKELWERDMRDKQSKTTTVLGGAAARSDVRDGTVLQADETAGRGYTQAMPQAVHQKG